MYFSKPSYLYILQKEWWNKIVHNRGSVEKQSVWLYAKELYRTYEWNRMEVHDSFQARELFASAVKEVAIMSIWCNSCWAEILKWEGKFCSLCGYIVMDRASCIPSFASGSNVCAKDA